MPKKIPYQTEVEVVGYRLLHSLAETEAKFGISRPTITQIMKRNPDLVDKFKDQLTARAVEKYNLQQR